MPHPKPRTKPRRREPRDPQARIVITAKGRALLELLDELRGLRAFRGALKDHITPDHGRATPCAPKRAAPGAPANNNDTAGTPAAHPRTPAGKSGAAAIAPDKEPQP